MREGLGARRWSAASGTTSENKNILIRLVALEECVGRLIERANTASANRCVATNETSTCRVVVDDEVGTQPLRRIAGALMALCDLVPRRRKGALRAGECEGLALAAWLAPWTLRNDNLKVISTGWSGRWALWLTRKVLVTITVVLSDRVLVEQHTCTVRAFLVDADGDGVATAQPLVEHCAKVKSGRACIQWVNCSILIVAEGAPWVAPSAPRHRLGNRITRSKRVGAAVLLVAGATNDSKCVPECLTLSIREDNQRSACSGRVGAAHCPTVSCVVWVVSAGPRDDVG